MREPSKLDFKIWGSNFLRCRPWVTVAGLEPDAIATRKVLSVEVSSEACRECGDASVASARHDASQSRSAVDDG